MASLLDDAAIAKVPKVIVRHLDTGSSVLMASYYVCLYRSEPLDALTLGLALMGKRDGLRSLKEKRHHRLPDPWRYRSRIPPRPQGEGGVGGGRVPSTAAAGKGQHGRRAAGDGRIGIGAVSMRTGPSHTTRHAGPHRAVRVVEVK